MAADPIEHDDQDGAEAFDEDNLDPDDTGPDAHEFKTFEELPDLLDDTRRQGDGSDAGDGRAWDEAEFSEDLVDEDDLDDDPLAAAGEDPDEPDDIAFAEDEVELVFTPDVERLRGAQGSAAHFETRRELSDADLNELGYQDDPAKEPS